MGCYCNIMKCACGTCFVPQRYFGAFITALIIIFSYCMRNCVSLAITRMVKEKKKSNKTKAGMCPPRPKLANPVKYGDNDWSEVVQSTILSSFYIGYLIAHIPGGYLADRYGSRWVLIIGFALSIASTATIPLAVSYMGYELVVVLRILQGAGQGVVFPGVSSYLTCWCPKHERGVLGSVSYSGNALGQIFGNFFTGIMMMYFDHWMWVFYLWSAISFFTLLIMVFWFYSNPASHPFMTDREKVYLEEQLVKQGKKKAPYGQLLIDPSAIGIIFGQVGHSLVIFYFSGNYPKYLDNVLNFNIRDNSLASAMPYFGLWISSIITGKLADYGIKKRKWDIGCTRKMYTTIASVGPTLCLIAAGYCKCDVILAVFFFTLALFLKGPFFSGLKVNIMDITTQYGGATAAFANGLGSIAGLAAPYICSLIAPDNTNDQWILVFWTLFGIALLFNILYAIVGSGLRSRFDYTDEEKKYLPEKKPNWYRCRDGVDTDLEAVRAGMGIAGPAKA